MLHHTELATSVEHGVPLRDFDASNETDGEFKKINTLGHFHLHVMVRQTDITCSIYKNNGEVSRHYLLISSIEKFLLL